jgi:large subunit ribosomal protein L22
MALSNKQLAGVRETRKGATVYKTNERPGTRAQVRYVRVSAYKAREVLDLIRGKHVAEADEILQFVERDVAKVIRKALASAVANAANNDGQDPEALYVSACYADEGPTLKRWRPRARGRATRIRKRTCHITIIVSRLSADDLEALRAREAASGRAGGGRAAAEARRERVARSRQAKAERKAADHDHEHDHDHDHDHGDEANEADVAEQATPVEPDEVVSDVDVDEEADVADLAEQAEPVEVEASAAEEQADAAAEAEGKED